MLSAQKSMGMRAATTRASKPMLGRRALVVVANEKQGKGGEEGGKVGGLWVALVSCSLPIAGCPHWPRRSSTTACTAR